MKKTISTIVFVTFLLITTNTAFADTNLQKLIPEVNPVIVDGNTLVPVRVLSEWMNLGIKWDAQQQLVEVGDEQIYQNTDSNTVAYPLTLQIGSMTADVKGISKPLDVPAIIYNGSTMIPLRFFAESLDVKVTWNSDTKQITFDKNGNIATLDVPVQSKETTAALQGIVDPIIKMKQFKEAALQGPDYLHLLKGSAKDKGKAAYFKGKVFQAIETPDGSTLILLDVGIDSQQLIAVLSKNSVDLVQDDSNVDVYGMVTEQFTYTTTDGTQKTVPAISLVTFTRNNPRSYQEYQNGISQ